MDRRDLLRLHRWVALVFAPLLFLQAITGTLLLFREPLEQLMEPAATVRTSAAVASLSTLVKEAGEAAGSGYRVTRIIPPATMRETAFVHLMEADGITYRYAAIDPGTGRALAVGSIWRFPLEAALQLHHRLVDGRFGMAIVLLNAVALISMTATGMLYWWPGRQRIAKALAVRPEAPARVRLRQWHRSIGVIVLPLMLFSATTGALLIVPDLLAPSAPAAVAPPSPGAVQVDEALARAKAVFPHADIRDIRFPPGDRMDVNFYAPRYNSQAIDMVSVRLSDGALLKRVPAESNPALWIKVLPLHSGTALGLPGRIFLGIEGLVLMILAVTGPLMWRQARRAKRRKA